MSPAPVVVAKNTSNVAERKFDMLNAQEHKERLTLIRESIQELGVSL